MSKHRDYTPDALGHATNSNKRREDRTGLHANVFHCQECGIFIQKLPPIQARSAFANHICNASNAKTGQNVTKNQTEPIITTSYSITKEQFDSL